jgi:tetratricopeptide (TPR) repeat protein
VDPVDQVKTFLKAQNLEQLGRIDEALELYERLIDGAFDAVGPYDRLISIYSDRAQHRDVTRVAASAIVNVHTYQQKKEWYAEMQAAAERAASNVPPAVPKRRP